MHLTVERLQPHRHRNGVEQCPPGQQLTGKLALLVEHLDEIALVGGDIAQAQHGVGAGGPAISFQMRAGDRLQKKAEGRAGLEQLIERFAQIFGRGLLEPTAEPQQLLVIGGNAGHARQGMRDDPEALARFPADHNLRLGLDDRFGQQQPLAQSGRFLPGPVHHLHGAVRGVPDDTEGDDRSADDERQQDQMAQLETNEIGGPAMRQADRQNAHERDACEQERNQLLIRAGNLVCGSDSLHGAISSVCGARILRPA